MKVNENWLILSFYSDTFVIALSELQAGSALISGRMQFFISFDTSLEQKNLNSKSGKRFFPLELIKDTQIDIELSSLHSYRNYKFILKIYVLYLIEICVHFLFDKEFFFFPVNFVNSNRGTQQTHK